MTSLWFLTCGLESLVWLEGGFDSPEEKLSLVSAAWSHSLQVASTQIAFIVFCTQKYFTPAIFVHIIRELTLHPSAEQRQWDVPDHEKPHPTKMLRSKYLNSSWALICMLEKLLDFVSLPTDFAVQVLSREKWAMKHSCKIYQYFLLYTLPPSESTCSRRLLQSLRLRPEMTCSWAVFTTASSPGMRRLFSERTPSNWTQSWVGRVPWL